MNRSESGYTVVEMVVVVSLSVIITLAATIFTFHTFQSTEQAEDRLTTVSHVENAGYWISSDAYIADNVLADDLTPPAFLIFKWTEWGYSDDNVYHSATYTIENLTNDVGQLIRRYQNSDGDDQQTLVASYIYYNPADPTNSTSVSYQNPRVSLKIATQFGGAREARNYEIYRRPNF
jgi:hypothetical protein